MHWLKCFSWIFLSYAWYSIYIKLNLEDELLKYLHDLIDAKNWKTYGASHRLQWTKLNRVNFLFLFLIYAGLQVTIHCFKMHCHFFINHCLFLCYLRCCKIAKVHAFSLNLGRLWNCTKNIITYCIWLCVWIKAKDIRSLEMPCNLSFWCAMRFVVILITMLFLTTWRIYMLMNLTWSWRNSWCAWNTNYYESLHLSYE